MGKFIFEDLPSTKTPINANNLNDMQDRLIDLIYPIGSIFMSTNSANPSSYLIGTWEQIKDTFLLSAGDIYEGGSTGGEAEHTLTVDEMPSHNHSFARWRGSGTADWGGVFGIENVDAVHKGDQNTSSIGGGQPHNNMPPYLTVYMWQRIE